MRTGQASSGPCGKTIFYQIKDTYDRVAWIFMIINKNL